MNAVLGLGSHPLLLVAVAFGMGFIAAIPIGACQIEVMKRAIHNHLSAALATVLGSTVADLVYGVVAFMGIAHFLQYPKVLAAFNIASAAILFLLAWLSIRQGNRRHTTDLEVRILKGRRISFVAGFMLSATNPLMLLWWLLGAKIVLELGLVPAMTLHVKLAFLASAALGLMAYLTTVALVLHATKHMISPRTLKRINVALGLILACMAVVFLAKGLKGCLPL